MARRSSTRSAPLAALFSQLARGPGQGLAVVRAVRKRLAVRTTVSAVQLPAGKSPRPKPARIRPETTQILAALGHPLRAQVLVQLLAEPATYRGLVELTGTEAGPLYHHLKQLRLAGLLISPGRDRYELTDRGCEAALLVVALQRMW